MFTPQDQPDLQVESSFATPQGALRRALFSGSVAGA
jgi:hypothetical protein